MVADRLPAIFSRIGSGADHRNSIALNSVHLEVVGPFVVKCGQFGGFTAGKDQVHGTDVAGSFFDHVDAFFQSGLEVVVIEAFDVVENLFVKTMADGSVVLTEMSEIMRDFVIGALKQAKDVLIILVDIINDKLERENFEYKSDN